MDLVQTQRSAAGTGPVIPQRYEPRLPISTFFRFRKDPLSFLRRLSLEHGNVVRFRLGPQDVFLLNDPELIRDVLITHDRRFTKGPGLRVAERLLGQGLLTSEGEFHKRQRRLAQPAFHRQRIAGYAGTMSGYAREWEDRWHTGDAREITREMGGLTLRIAAKTLFDTEVLDEIRDISEALTESLRLFTLATLPFAGRIERYLPFITRRFDRTRARLDDVVYRIIAERRASGEDRGDLLSMLLLAADAEGDGSGMTDLQLRDEAMTLLLAGHETTANALAWTWYLLAQNPEAEARLHAEVDEVLGGAVPSVDDVARLPYTRMVVSESMRCFPPAWIIVRRADEECPLDGFTLPQGAIVMMAPWVTHHDPTHYPDPFRFDPGRWTPEVVAGRPKHAYYPFGGGSRLCIGEQFAWMELVLVLATLASRWRFRLLSGQRIVPQPVITLRPKYGVRMVIEHR